MQPDCLIVSFPNDKQFIIDDNSDIGRYSRVACKNKMSIEENVFTGPNVFISDYNHTYKNINVPIKNQEDTVYAMGITILDDV